MRKLVLSLIALALLAVAGVFLWLRYVDAVMQQPGPHAEAVVLEVRPGMGVRAVRWPTRVPSG